MVLVQRFVVNGTVEGVAPNILTVMPTALVVGVVVTILSLLARKKPHSCVTPMADAGTADTV